MAGERHQPQFEDIRRRAMAFHQARRIGVVRDQGGESLNAARIGHAIGVLTFPKIEHGLGPLIDLCSARHRLSISARQRLRQGLTALQQSLRSAAFLSHT
jgi:hypothetical protein